MVDSFNNERNNFMDTQLATITTDNYDLMASAMGMGKTTNTDSSITIPRMKIEHRPIMDTVDAKGKKRQMEVVPGGTFALTDNNGDVHYSEGITFRPFLQRFRYVRWVPFNRVDEMGRKGKFIKSVFSTQDTFNSSDHMDTDGGFNCGRPSGYIKDWKALPEATQRLISSVKRVRTLFGIASSNEAVNEKGEPLDDPINMPVIWEINNKDAFKVMGEAVQQYFSAKRLLPEHSMTITTEGTPMANGNMLFAPIASVDLSKKIDISEEDQDTFRNFVEWVEGQNTWIKTQYEEKSNEVDFSKVEEQVIDEFVTVAEEL
jgi:hypothetical protein